MGISGWELLEVCHHPDKSCDHKHCDCGDSHVTSSEHMFKWLCEFKGGLFPRRFITLPCLVAAGLVQVEI